MLLKFEVVLRFLLYYWLRGGVGSFGVIIHFEHSSFHFFRFFSVADPGSHGVWTHFFLLLFFLNIFKIIRKMENKWRKTAWNSLSFPVCFSSTDQNEVELIMLLFGHTSSVYFSHFIICFLWNNYVNMNQTCHLVYSKLYLICIYYIQCNPMSVLVSL
jgi:hypothetical protein